MATKVKAAPTVEFPVSLYSTSQAMKLIARILRKNPDNGGAAVIESIRDIVSSTGYDVNYNPDA